MSTKTFILNVIWCNTNTKSIKTGFHKIDTTIVLKVNSEIHFVRIALLCNNGSSTFHCCTSIYILTIWLFYNQYFDIFKQPIQRGYFYLFKNKNTNCFFWAAHFSKLFYPLLVIESVWVQIYLCCVFVCTLKNCLKNINQIRLISQMREVVIFLVVWGFPF